MMAAIYWPSLAIYWAGVLGFLLALVYHHGKGGAPIGWVEAVAYPILALLWPCVAVVLGIIKLIERAKS